MTRRVTITFDGDGLPENLREAVDVAANAVRAKYGGDFQWTAAYATEDLRKKLDVRQAIRTEALRRVREMLTGTGRTNMRKFGLDMGNILGLKIINLKPGDNYHVEGTKIPIEDGDLPITVDDIDRDEPEDT